MFIHTVTNTRSGGGRLGSRAEIEKTLNDCLKQMDSHLNKKNFFKRKEIISPRWEILLFEDNNMAVLTSCEYSLYLAVKNKG